MTIRITADHKTSGAVRHSWFPESGFGILALGSDGLGNLLYFDDTADVDAVIAELVALKQEMSPPVITNSARDCDEQNPDGSGEHCHRGGDHGVHQDSNGDEWRTDGATENGADL